MKKSGIAFLVVLLFVLKSYSQGNTCTVKYYTSDRIAVTKDSLSDFVHQKDSINFKNHQNIRLVFYNDKLFLNNKKIHQFKRVDYYYYIAYIEKDNKEYLYIYPHYKNRTGPYIWYGLGVLIEINEKEILVKGEIDYFERFEICDVIAFDKYIIVKRVSL